MIVIGGIGYVGTILTDLCAIGALAAALHSGVTPPALMVGYGMTTLAAVTFVGWMIDQACFDRKLAKCLGLV